MKLESSRGSNRGRTIEMLYCKFMELFPQSMLFHPSTFSFFQVRELGRQVASPNEEGLLDCPFTSARGVVSECLLMLPINVSASGAVLFKGRLWLYQQRIHYLNEELDLGSAHSTRWAVERKLTGTQSVNVFKSSRKNDQLRFVEYLREISLQLRKRRWKNNIRVISSRDKLIIVCNICEDVKIKKKVTLMVSVREENELHIIY